LEAGEQAWLSLTLSLLIVCDDPGVMLSSLVEVENEASSTPEGLALLCTFFFASAISCIASQHLATIPCKSNID
jgi:hypothetical protein